MLPWASPFPSLIKGSSQNQFIWRSSELVFEPTIFGKSLRLLCIPAVHPGKTLKISTKCAFLCNRSYWCSAWLTNKHRGD